MQIAGPAGILRKPKLVVPAHAPIGEAQDVGEDFLAVEASQHPPEWRGSLEGILIAGTDGLKGFPKCIFRPHYCVV